MQLTLQNTRQEKDRENFITGKQQWLKHNDIWQHKSPKQSDGKV